ncbi:MAG: biotin--[acetyl-CoA-carboxylase] ligase [Chloroflexi bacterium]|nr:biotin--[acetyl-CoA-carboxylase] ligase [Chloroflexota bacterium]
MIPNFGKVAGSLAIVGSKIVYKEETTSTMNDAWDFAGDGAPEGTVVIADYQTAGRGRHDRTWVSRPAQDILCSVLFRPRVALAGELLMIAALAVVQVADSFGVETGIKWPNDVQVSGKKLAGVIAESVTGIDNESSEDSTGHVTAVVGIGLNVNLDPTEQASAAPSSSSLSAELGREVDRLDVFTKLLGSLDHQYLEISAGGSVLSRWRDRITTLGREITVVDQGEGNTANLRGTARDVDSIGRLIVRDADGRDWPVSAGEVTVKDIT